MNRVFNGIVAASILCALGASRAEASCIIFAQGQLPTCLLMLPPQAVIDYEVVAVLGADGSATGITGAEFRIDGSNPAWMTLMVTPNPAAFMATGDPLGDGCDITFSNCIAHDVVLLYTITVVAFAPESGRVLRIMPHMTPADPQFACPSLVLCGSPMTRICTGAGVACINDTTGGCCPVEGTASRSWSAVKDLYRR